MKKNSQKGISLLITLLIMSAILAIAIGISSINIGEIKITRESPRSLIAFYAGETGIEQALYEDRANGRASESYEIIDVCIDSLSEICYKVETFNIVAIPPDTVSSRSIDSTGSYKGTWRVVEASYGY